MKKNNSFCRRLDSGLKIFTNIAVIIGLLFTYIQIGQVKIQMEKTNEYEMRRQSVETLKKIRTKDFIFSLSKIKSTIKKGEELNYDELESFLKDLNYVLNVYDDISLIYLSGIADKRIIEQNIKNTLIDFSNQLNQIRIIIPKDSKNDIQYQLEINRINIENLIKQMK